jgi:predicted DNA-binding transcriptional regulator AlpA
MTTIRKDSKPGRDRDNSSQVNASPIFFTEKQLAERWNISVKAIQRWRVVGQGPRWVKLGAAVRYPLAEIERYEDQAIRANTSQTAKG